METTTSLIPIKLTERAITEVANIVNSKKIPENYGLRVGVRGGGCGGAGFFIGFDKANDEDKIYQIQNFEVYIDRKHFMYLLDVELDFEERAEEQGFVFNTPQQD
ncbi:iron-sulfur cluster assembly accessory protein [Flammeovirgaceae bacterium SG7u.111]|nr:iron-sulfur cluster assembly accessory protein [Flammeovirgaceae bacterium SG7u.132]WPO33094.1 iron-sulfur cluster assembly accessory protein [Flammeovirgaceae bacterium SG7u.111]